MNVPRTIILSRPDNLGDAVVTLTTAGWIKHHAPQTRIIALVKQYTLPIWTNCIHIDAVITLDELERKGDRGAAEHLRSLKADAIVHVFPHRAVARWAKAAGIPRRIGTGHRWWHWFTCNERVSFSRKRSLLHEAQLNIKLLAPFGIPMPADVKALVPHIGLVAPPASEKVKRLIRADRRNMIVHPLKGSGVEWGLSNFAELIRSLDPAVWHCIITGTADEAQRYHPQLPVDLPHVTDAGGQLDLEELLQLMPWCNGLVAASTGPLHMAAACGIRAIGLFSMMRPIFPARWAPLGVDAHYLVNDPNCEQCASGKRCDCITRIPPSRVKELLMR
jgi:heptosyltransferase III